MVIITSEHAKALQEREIDLGIGVTLEFNGSLGVPCSTLGGVSFECTHLGAMSVIAGGTSVMYTTIGNYTSIGHKSGVVLPHPLDRLTTSNATYGNPFPSRTFPGMQRADPFPQAYIGNDVWVGAHVVYKAGIRIGDGAIVGAGAIVTKDVPPFAIVVGNPARILRYRFDDNTQDRIKKCRWFDYDWSGIELPWADALGTLSRMEELLAEGQVPLANKAYVYTVEGARMQLRAGVRREPIV